jgi:hypothetical protein
VFSAIRFLNASLAKAHPFAQSILVAAILLLVLNSLPFKLLDWVAKGISFEIMKNDSCQKHFSSDTHFKWNSKNIFFSSK